jgi:hypothetical protein
LELRARRDCNSKGRPNDPWNNREQEDKERSGVSKNRQPSAYCTKRHGKSNGKSGKHCQPHDKKCNWETQQSVQVVDEEKEAAAFGPANAFWRHSVHDICDYK